MKTGAFSNSWSLTQDLDVILVQTESIWLDLQNAHLFITGGTGFIGCWLLEALRHADMQMALGLRVSVLTRNLAAFHNKAPHLVNYPAFEFVSGDVTCFPTPEGHFTHIIHAATDASADLNENNPLLMFGTIIQGAQRVLDMAVEKQIPRILFLSSGAVYGQQPWEMERVSENWLGGPSSIDPRNTYAEAKRASEMLCAIYGKQRGVHTTIARIFSLLGPYLTLNAHFASGNFIRNAIDGRSVIVNGDGLPCRSYLYASDLVVWLLHLLIRGESGRPYNVGSEQAVSIRQLAEHVATEIGTGDVDVRGTNDTGWNPGRYVPDTQRIRNELGMVETVSLNQAIRRTAYWNGWKGNT
jgi:nucleoside-diphosphate-sugar epimerase